MKLLSFELIEKLSQRDTDMAEHIMTLYNLVKNTKAKTVVEIGAGQSTYVLMFATQENGGKFYSIDICKEAYLRFFPEGKEYFLSGIPEYISIEGDSLEVVKSWTKPIDFLMIDSSHTYKQTVGELKEWTKFVKKGGTIVLHDTINSDPDCGVRKALDEFLEKGGYSVAHYSDTKRIGLSVLTKNV